MVDLHAVYARNDNAHHVVAGLAQATPALAEVWQQLDRALDDIRVLGAIIEGNAAGEGGPVAR